jgi:muramoyltetrapeptide carboxypeptidase
VIEIHLDQLRLAGKLNRIAGVVVGELKDCDWSEKRPEAPRNRSIEDVLERCLAPLGVPVLYKLPLGHGNTSRPSHSGSGPRWMPMPER